MSDKLVAYFSASGTTRAKAKELSALAGADLYEIEPVKKYTDKDLDWNDNKSRSSIEMKDSSSRPEIVKKSLDVSNYKTIYLGFPIWWYTAPTIIKTFLDSYDFYGTRFVLFATSGGSGLGKSALDLHPCAPEADFISGKVVRREADLKELLSL